MSVTYEKAPPAVLELIRQVMKEHHERLCPMVAVGAVMAYSSDARPAVKLHGAACAATIRLTNPRQRRAVEGTPDAIITIDGNRWEFLSPAQQQALLDHELTHLELIYKDASPELASDGRPKLRMRPDDWTLTGFAEVVERHGPDALEMMSLKELRQKHGQLLLWADDPTAAG